MKEFIRYTSLNVIGMLGLSCYILADTFFVAKGLGANGLAALNLAIPIYSLIHGSGLMLGMGGATRYSILKSQNLQKEANKAFTHTLLLGIFLSIVFFLVGVFGADSITTLLRADKDVYAMCKTYLQVILLFAPAFICNDIMLCFVRNDGSPRLSMIAMVSGSLSNMLLDYIFIFPLGMGIFGAVFATGLAPIISLSILSVFFVKKQNQFHPVKCKISGKMWGHIAALGTSSLIAEVSSGIVMIVFNTIILGMVGNAGVAAYGVIANLSLVVIAVYTGIAQGIQPLISKNYGKGNKQNIQSVFKYAMVTVFILSAAIYVAVSFGADAITSVFNSENNRQLQEIAVWGLKLYFTACVFVGCNIILSIYFTSVDSVKPAHVISMLRGFLLIIPLAFLLPRLGGMTGLWLAFPITECIVAIIGALLYLQYRRSMKRPRPMEFED